MQKSKQLPTFDLYRDNVMVARHLTDVQLIAWIHAHHSYSFDHAIAHEGYSVKSDDVSIDNLVGTPVQFA